MTGVKPQFKFKTNLKKRIFATVLDYGLFFLASNVYLLAFGEDNGQGGQSVSGLLALPVLLAWFIYFIAIESLSGATLGHQGFNLRVLTIDRKPIGFRQALKRHLLDPIDILFYGIPGIIAVKNSERHQRLGDMWAKTVVVDVRDPEQYYQK